MRNGYLAIFLVAACTATETPRPATTSVEPVPAASAPSGGKSVSDERQVTQRSDADLAAQDIPKAERAVGYMVLVAGVLVLFLAAVAIYSIGKILIN